MRKNLITLIVLLIISSDAYSQNWYWAKHAGSQNYDEYSAICVDVWGNVYATGFFMAPYSIFDNDTLQCSGFTDIYLAKYDPNGNLIWAKRAGGNFGGTSSDGGSGIVLDNSGHLYVTGGFYQNAMFDTISLTGYGLEDIFIAKYDTSGQCIWAKKAGGGGDDGASSITIDTDNNLFITDNFEVSANFGSINLIGSNMGSMFVAKYDSSGNCKWAKTASGNGSNSFGINVIGISVYDIDGRKVYEINSKKDAFTLDLSEKNKGIYFLTIKENEKITTKKIAIQ